VANVSACFLYPQKQRRLERGRRRIWRIDFKTREELIAAGVPQPADLGFVERSQREILGLVKSGSACCGPIARQLNAKGILNNVGGNWTDRIVKIFADRYLRGRVRY
jgi:hypothetical protein